ncbi:MAG: MBL fold metallo-hydrolase [Thermodesulfobacteriota bacterium]|nr:MBL fold metallo-hydrolase [Thermodesulfobacteriota bacterium]
MDKNEGFPLIEVDRVEILTVIDNYVDLLLANTDTVTRPPLANKGGLPSDTLLAEHGLSLLVTVYKGEEKHTILFDAGYSPVGVLHNMAQLGINTERLDAIVISHGHMDHTGGLYGILDGTPMRVPLVLHPDVFLFPRYFGLDDGRRLLFPRCVDRDKLKLRKVDVLESRAPTTLFDDMILVTGEIERVTGFEKGLPNALLERNGKTEQDPITDDQGLVINLKGKGLVIISGCSHAGIVNTVLFAKQITGIERIHGILGGFHLTGPFFEQIIEETINELRGMEPQVLVPMHCTGWKAIQRFEEEFPSSFVLNSVGSTFTLS